MSNKRAIALTIFSTWSDRPFLFLMTDRLSRIKIDGPSHQIPNTAMILRSAIAPPTKYQIDVCGTIKVNS
ncbi:hypothetical protein [Microcoleus vaginatus]|uniref:hypothetical protein n=1 Tax=Microcoleus vaginatus TaxID=119532 RepID=UPI0032ABE3DA